jgi:hypothetical protein
MGVADTIVLGDAARVAIAFGVVDDENFVGRGAEASDRDETPTTKKDRTVASADDDRNRSTLIPGQKCCFEHSRSSER